MISLDVKQLNISIFKLEVLKIFKNLFLFKNDLYLNEIHETIQSIYNLIN